MKHWDPTLFDLVVGGFTIQGYADGSMIEWEEDGPRFVVVKGVDGQLTRYKVAGRVSTITSHLMQSSSSNDVLSALHLTDMATDGGGGVVAGLIRDRNGITNMAFPAMFVEGFPKYTASDKVEDIPWKIICCDYLVFVGGM